MSRTRPRGFRLPPTRRNISLSSTERRHLSISAGWDRGMLPPTRACSSSSSASISSRARRTRRGKRFNGTLIGPKRRTEPMPLYEYLCASCKRKTEVLQDFGEKPLKICPHCGGKLKKLMSSPAIQFKGSGWYVTDYAKQGPPPA